MTNTTNTFYDTEVLFMITPLNTLQKTYQITSENKCHLSCALGTE